MSRQDDWYADRSRQRAFGDDEGQFDLSRQGPELSGSVTAIGIVTIIVGSLGSLAGLCGLGIGLIAGANARIGADQVGAALAIVLMLAILLWSVGLIVGGIGIVGRSSWGRVLTLVLAGFGIMFGLGCVVVMIFALSAPPPPRIRGDPDPRIIGFIVFLILSMIFLGHAAWAFVALLGRRVRAEFRS